MSELDDLTPVRLGALSAETLTRRVWRFGVIDQPSYARHVRLLDDGRIAGQLGDNEHRWRIDGQRLAFLDRAEQRSTDFDRVYVDGEGRVAMVGAFRGLEGPPHVLREVDPISAAATTGPAELLWRRPRASRRNLVLLRANEDSVHPQWPREMTDEDRNWDLCVSFYGRDENFVGDDGAEYRVLQNHLRKYTAVHALMHAGSPLWDYEYIALPDDDLMLSWRDWNTLFAVCRDHRLELAQPAMSPGHVVHPITRQDERYRLRYTSFVEVMCPIFSRGALRACVETFRDGFSSFGLDNIWPKLLGEPRDRIAVIDAVAMTHTRPQAAGGAYSIEDAIIEGNALQHLYDAPSHVLEYGGILATPVNRQHAW